MALPDEPTSEGWRQNSDLAVACLQADLTKASPRQAADQRITRASEKKLLLSIVAIACTV